MKASYIKIYSFKIFEIVYFLTAIVLFAGCDSTPVSDSNKGYSGGLPPEGYALVWSDEFDTPGFPNMKNWSYDTEANESGWYNNELQYYAAARPENSLVKNGKLIISATKESLTGEPDYGGQKYTSARLITLGKASWTYGFFEIRARLPKGVGTWPAIWMLGTADKPWPSNGEIDIMEQVGKKPDEISGTVHDEATKDTFGIGGSTTLPDAEDNFHNYQLLWTPNELIFAVDNIEYFRYANPGTDKKSWPFDDPQYLILNLAIGGDMGGPAVDDGIFPARMEIDYVRVYQKNE